MKLYQGHSHVEIWRHTSDAISLATPIAQVSGFTGLYADPVGTSSTYYYWVRAVNANDIKGPFNSSSGTVGQTAVDVDFMLTLLTDQITNSQLAQNLEERIDLIDAAATVQNSVAWRVAQETIARANDIAAIVTDIPIYDSTEAYAVDQIVRISNGNSKVYICIQAVGANSGIVITEYSFLIGRSAPN